MIGKGKFFRINFSAGKSKKDKNVNKESETNKHLVHPKIESYSNKILLSGKPKKQPKLGLKRHMPHVNCKN